MNRPGFRRLKLAFCSSSSSIGSTSPNNCEGFDVSRWFYLFHLIAMPEFVHADSNQPGESDVTPPPPTIPHRPGEGLVDSGGGVKMVERRGAGNVRSGGNGNQLQDVSPSWKITGH